MEENTNQEQVGIVQSPPVEGKPLSPLRVGIICKDTNREDLLEYKDELISINHKLGGRVELVLFGYNGVDEEGDWLKGVNFEFVKPCGITHYFKQLSSLNLDLVFVPLTKTKYNVTSENYNKFLEAGLFQIPLVTVGIFPYQKIIQDKVNGFLYKEKHELIPLLEHLHIQRKLVQDVGRNAYHDVTTEFNYSPENMRLISDLFVKPQEQE